MQRSHSISKTLAPGQRLTQSLSIMPPHMHCRIIAHFPAVPLIWNGHVDAAMAQLQRSALNAAFSISWTVSAHSLKIMHVKLLNISHLSGSCWFSIHGRNNMKINFQVRKRLNYHCEHTLLLLRLDHSGPRPPGGPETGCMSLDSSLISHIFGTMLICFLVHLWMRRSIDEISLASRLETSRNS